MTVIAYSSKHRIMAADSRCTNGATIKHVTNIQKLYRLPNGALLGAAGNGDSRDIRKLLAKASPKNMPTRKQLVKLEYDDIEALIVFPTGQVFIVSCEYDEDCDRLIPAVDRISDVIVAIGTGANFAYGAMEFGASPIEAVEVACRRDIMCFGPIQSEKL